jgi:peptidoglycan/xylan/chitin deacetylase (PgdA/CDA1 family)
VSPVLRETRSGLDEAGVCRRLSENCSRLLKVVIALLYLPLDSMRCALLRLLGYPLSARFVTLMYHSVKSDERRQFAHQMDLLIRLAHPVAGDFSGCNDAHNRIFVAVTFDDGYQSIMENALPILREKKIPVTVFVPTDSLGTTPGWITNGRHRDASERLLTSGELKSIQQSGGRIGSHSVTHRPLTELTPTEALAELTESRQVLEKILGQNVDSFALPYGAGDAEVLRLAAEAGYQRVFLSEPVNSRAGFEGPVCGRIGVSPSDWALEYRLKVLGAYQWLPVGIALKRRIVNVLRWRVRAA